MLTIKAPIELKCDTAMVSSQEAFCSRIRGNYEMISAGIDREDLLHVVTAPPEIYLGGDGMVSIVNNATVRNRQEMKLETINNLLNRIVLTEDVKLTYQDRVYITDMLTKLGVQNVQQFMTQVSQLKMEIDTMERLINLYWNHMEEVTDIVNEYHQREISRGSDGETLRESRRTELHEQILDRLQTGAIYQILSSFYASHGGGAQYVTRQELQITEQKRTATNMLLNRLENIAGGGEVPFVYRHENIYENLKLEEDNTTDEQVNNQITSAVLLNLIDNLYFNQVEKNRAGSQLWLHMENALYQTAENTLMRLKQEITGSAAESSIRREEREVIQRLRERELQTLSEMLILERLEPWTQREMSAQVSEESFPETEGYEGAEMEYPPQEIDKAPEDETPESAGREIIREHTELLGSVVRQYLQSVVLQDRRQQFFSQAELYYGEEEASEQEEGARSRPASETREEIQDRPLPQTVLEKWESRTLPQETPPDTQEMETLAAEEIDYYEQLQQINRQNIENYNHLQQAIRQQEQQRRQEKKKKRAGTGAELTKRESLRALQDPEGLLMEYRQEAQEEAAQRGTRQQELLQLLPEETRRIYERLEQYRNAPEASRLESGISENNMGLLLHDIQQVEEENYHSSQTVSQETERIRELSETAIEKWNRAPAGEQNIRSQYETVRDDISLVHKSLESQVDEETIRQLLEQDRKNHQTTSVTNETLVESNVTNTTTVQQQTATNRVMEERELTELIQRGVQNQMDVISERVYTQLERRLQNEKKRRGY